MKKYTTFNRQVAAWQKKNKDEVTHKLLKNYDATSLTSIGLSEKDLYKTIKISLNESIDNNKPLKAREFKEKTEALLRTRLFKSQKEFYRESILSSIKASKDTADGDSNYKKLRSFFKDERGRFEKITDADYHGKVNYDGVDYSYYTFTNSQGKLLHVYEAGSPKGQFYKLLVLENPL